MKKRLMKNMPADWCLFCDLGVKPVNGKHQVPCHDHRDDTMTTFTVRCKKESK